MTAQLIQSIQLMTLPLQDLQLRIHEELEVNPALEIVEEAPTISLDESPEATAEFQDFDDYGDSSAYESGYRGDDSDGDSKRRFLEGAIATPESLHEHLVWQLRLQPISELEFSVGELLIRNLDDNGFFIDDPALVIPPERHALIEPICTMIRAFEPVGTCVANYVESLAVQAELMPEYPAHTLELIRGHLEALDRGKTKEVAKALGAAESDVLEALEFIRRLTPFPGRMFSTEVPRYVVPDLQVVRKEGQFVIVLNDEEIPVLGINHMFAEVATAGDRNAKQFASQSVKNARWFIHSIQQRNQTLLKVARAVVEFQRDFFLKGKKYLVPLILKDIANEIGMSEATVSRITNGKYVQTEWGIFELKHFFSNSIAPAGSGGSRFSKEGVKETIRELLEQHSHADKALSDQKIADLLADRGIKLARRTVAKYRKELDISSSYER